MLARAIVTNRKELSEVCTDSKDEYEQHEISTALKDTHAALVRCAGLAAPQIGYKKRIILVNVQGKLTIMINPKVVSTKGKCTFGNESCFSVPSSMNTPIRVKRWFKVKIVYWNEEGDLIEKLYKSFEARLIQHEIDHLDGVVIR